MPIKPDADTLSAYTAMKENPNYGHDALEAVLNDSPELADLVDGLAKAGLVKVVKEKE